MSFDEALIAGGSPAGEAMAAMVARHDWSATPLGPRAAWPAPLTSAVDLVLRAATPMAIFWGPELRLIYNDPWKGLIGTKHPAALGAKGCDALAEIWPVIGPRLQAIRAGAPGMRADDQLLPLRRDGAIEDAWFTYGLSPIMGDDGSVDGVLNIAFETTERISADARRQESDARLRRGVSEAGLSADFSALFDAAPAPMLVLSPKRLNIIAVNDAYLAATSTRREDLLGRHIFDAFPDDPELPGASGVRNLRASLERVIASGETDAMPIQLYPIPRPDGSFEERWWDPVNTPVLAADGSVALIIHCVEDVTERRRAQEWLKAAFSIRTVAIMTWSRDFKLTDMNAAFLEMTGYTRDEALGLRWAELTPDEFVDPSLQAIAEIDARGETTPYEKQYLRKDGTRFWGLFAARRVGDEVVEFVLDVTARRMAEHALQASEAKFQAIANSIDQMIWATRSDGFHDYFNDRWYEYTGVPYGSTDGDAWNGIFHPEDQERAWEVWRRCLATGDPYHIEYRLRHRSGQYRWVIGRAQPVRDGGDQIVRWYGTCTDIHDLKEAETALRRLNETLENRVIGEVARRMRTEEALRQSQKLEAIGQLTGGVAHDFNNLLTVIRSAADLLRRPELAEEKRARYLEAISDTADRAAKLTAQLLAFARRQALKPEVFDVSDRVAAIADMLRTVVGPRVELVADTSCGTCHVEADPTQFETALVNMAVNARDAMNGAGRLTIHVEARTAVPAIRGHGAADGPFVSVSVSDTGIGIPADKLGHIFEPFYTTKEVGKGTGLGLSQVYGFAKQSGGEVDVESTPGEGTRFVLYLPRVEAQARAPAPEAARNDHAPGKGHLLVVEDNEQVGAFSTQLLAELGFETSWAANGQQALDMLEARSGDFVAVFSDVVMPGMSGVELGREVRRRWPNLPVVLTSGYSQVLASDARHGFELIHKPYSVDELTRVLSRAIRRPVLESTE